MKLDKWQEEVIAYEGNILVNKGRRVGATHVMGIKAIEYLMTHHNTHPTSQIICVSLTEDQAKLIIMFALQYAQEKYPKAIGKGHDKPTGSRIVMNVDGNRRILLARPVGLTGDAVRGFEGQILMVDEASRMPLLFWIAATPLLLTTGGKIWMWSTPHGMDGKFWDSYQNKNNRYKVWDINTEEVMHKRPISESWTKEQRVEALKHLDDERKDMTALAYGQEYLGMFLEDLRRFFDDKLIERCCILKRKVPAPKEDNYMGCDIARLGDDESSFEILHAEYKRTIRQIENITTTKQLTTQTENRIKQLTTQFQCKKVGIDAGSGSLGVGIYDHLLNDDVTKRKVIAMNNRTISLNRDGTETQRMFKEDLYDNMKSMMEHEEVLFLADEDLVTSLRSIQFEIPKDEGQKMTRIKIFGTYDHICEGLTRACWLAKKERHKKFFIHSI